MDNQELHQRTVIALARAACSPMVGDADIDLLCWHCGIKREDIKGVKTSGYRLGDLAVKPEIEGVPV